MMRALSALTRRPLSGLPAGYTPAAPRPPLPPTRPAFTPSPSGRARLVRLTCVCGDRLEVDTHAGGKPGTLANADAKTAVYAALSRHRKAWGHSAWAGAHPQEAAADLARWIGD